MTPPYEVQSGVFDQTQKGEGIFFAFFTYYLQIAWKGEVANLPITCYNIQKNLCNPHKEVLI